MNRELKKSFISVVILLALTFSALGVTPALADDGVTPPSDAPVVVDAPVADAPATVDAPAAVAPAAVAPVADAPVADAPAAVDAPVVVDPSVALDAPAAVAPVVVDAPAAVDAPVAVAPVVVNAPVVATPVLTPQEILAVVPEDTDLVVQDANDETLPFASVAAAKVLAAPDPYFYVGGTIFRFFGGATDCADGGYVAQCFDNTPTPIQDAIDFLATNDLTPDDGSIYVDSGTYDENVEIDGSRWTNLSDLTLQGDGSASTTINGSLNIYSLTNAFSLNYLAFTDWVNIETAGDVNVYDVAIDGTTADGGMTITSGGNVDITSLDSTQSSSDGLFVDAAGDINIWDSSFYDNTQDGAYLYSDTSSIYIDSSNFVTNGDNGVEANTVGDVSIGNSGFYGNTQDGAYLYSDAGSIYADGSDFSNNGVNGVEAEAVGDVSIGNSSFYDNTEDGAYLYSDAGSIYVDSSDFSNNGINGLEANAFGDISLNNVSSQDSGSAGADLSSSDGGIFVDNSNLSNNGGSDLIYTAPYTQLCGTSFSGQAIDGCIAYSIFGEDNGDDSAPVVQTAPAEVVSAASLPEITLDNLPAPLPPTLADGSTFTFAGGFSTASITIPEGGSAVVSFSLPKGIDPAKLSVLMWNGTGWIELTDFVINPDGTISLTITFTGDIVFGQK